jgi:hypothetical protein
VKRLIWFFTLLLFAGAVVAAKQAYDCCYHLESLELRVAVPVCRAAREIYPFSVIPGGVVDSQELAASIQRDPVARQHYQDIRPERVWVTSADKPMLAYVSYRKGDAVYWTDHEVKIAAGERLLTDGINLIRGRCGNRIAFRRPVPLAATTIAFPVEGPPPDIVFETPLPELIPPTVIEPVPPGAMVARAAPPGPSAKSVSPPVWCCAVRPNIAVVPEPGTLLLLGTGLMTAVTFFGKKSRR